jgi:hypothetical protein
MIATILEETLYKFDIVLGGIAIEHYTLNNHFILLIAECLL